MLVASGVLVWELRYRTDTTVTPVDVDVVVSLFQQHAAAAAGDTDVLPANGVYTYTTTGSDQVDALGGASHRYPVLSTITVTRSGCGATQRWVAAEERWDEFTTCVTADENGQRVRLTDVTAFHRFFGADERETYTCEGDPRPIGAPAGTTWVTTCTKSDGDDVQTWTGTVIGGETINVGGDAVAVEHVAVMITDSEPENSQRTDSWYLAGTDLVVRRVIANTTTNGSPVGDVHYVEHADITLSSLTPTR